ncbi:hypothetical protein NY547_11035 [Cnuibacter physcomitrellae]|uniref:hypothetical protein n=1 Tax=Cnuibacter physcomitrellae TaxID=1619308 RepID=UPI002175B701|nr:hypothetical protein [Cnuibacter physcomitrellae]MCS5497771.1 hypothetical protein [Cnuibacter physcomitrellae]
MGGPAVHGFGSPGPSGHLVITDGPEAGTIRFDVELDRNFGGIWPRLHAVVIYRPDPAGGLIVRNEPVRRVAAYRGRSTLGYSAEQDPEVCRLTADALRGRLRRLGVSGDVTLSAVDTSVETGEAFGRVVGELMGALIADHLNGRDLRFEEAARNALDDATRRRGSVGGAP